MAFEDKKLVLNQFFVIDFANFVKKSDFQLLEPDRPKKCWKTSIDGMRLLFRFLIYLILLRFRLQSIASKNAAEEMKIEADNIKLRVPELQH